MPILGTLASSFDNTVAARGLFSGGSPSSGKSNVIDYIQIASTGNAIDFGDLTINRAGVGSCASSTRALFAGGNLTSGDSNVIDYVTIDTTGNATDFGDLTIVKTMTSAFSNAHGGL